MNYLPKIRSRMRGAAIAIALTLAATVAVAEPADASFLADRHATIQRMRKQMEPTPSGNVERDFLEALLPHDQAAIDLAESALRHATNERVRRIAETLIAERRREVADLRRALSESVPDAPPPERRKREDPRDPFDIGLAPPTGATATEAWLADRR